jgi:hypothetical protein
MAANFQSNPIEKHMPSRGESKGGFKNPGSNLQWQGCGPPGTAEGGRATGVTTLVAANCAAPAERSSQRNDPTSKSNCVATVNRSVSDLFQFWQTVFDPAFPPSSFGHHVRNSS